MVSFFRCPFSHQRGFFFCFFPELFVFVVRCDNFHAILYYVCRSYRTSISMDVTSPSRTSTAIFFSCNAAAHIGNASILIDKLHGSNLIMSRNVVGDICKLIRYLCLSKQHGRYFSIFRNQICRYRRLWREMQFSIFHG